MAADGGLNPELNLEKSRGSASWPLIVWREVTRINYQLIRRHS